MYYKDDKGDLQELTDEKAAEAFKLVTTAEADTDTITATYSKASKLVTLSFADATLADNDTIAMAGEKLYDTAGNTVSAITYKIAGTKWNVQQ